MYICFSILLTGVYVINKNCLRYLTDRIESEIIQYRSGDLVHDNGGGNDAEHAGSELCAVEVDLHRVPCNKSES